jgi:hypothetical protein
MDSDSDKSDDSTSIMYVQNSVVYNFCWISLLCFKFIQKYLYLLYI